MSKILPSNQTASRILSTGRCDEVKFFKLNIVPVAMGACMGVLEDTAPASWELTGSDWRMIRRVPVDINISPATVSRSRPNDGAANSSAPLSSPA